MPSTARERLAGLLAAQDEVPSSVQLRAKPPGDLHLHVDGLGRITLPVPTDQARRLCALGRPARFGRGEKTLTDATVRNTWEIPRELVRVEWAGTSGLTPALEAVREELGLPQHCRLTADLHSLLVYEQGQFFLPHQDSEKDDAMIATLVVTLPSAHTGGELVVHHLGETTTYRGPTTRVSLVAFYADCRHEVRPVTSGHRITLTYDLLLHGDPSHRVPDKATVGDAARYLREHFTTRVRDRYRDTTGDPPHRLVFLLDHEYTARSLGWSRLKGTDGSRASLLRAAADVAGCEAVLALTDIQETWDAYEPGWDDDYDDYEDEDEDDGFEDDGVDTEGDDGTGYQLNELIDSSVRLTRWTDPTGTSAENVSLVLDDAEVCTATPSSELRPYTSEYEGYMGNYGNTLDRWYRRAAVVLWPRDRSFTNRAEASPSWAMDELSARAGDGDPAAARTAAATLAPFWVGVVRSHERRGQLLTKALPAAIALDDAATASMLLHPFAIEDLAGRHATALAELAGRHGEPWTDDLLRAWFGDAPTWASANVPSRPQWITTVPTVCDALQAAEGRTDAPGTSTTYRLLERAWDSLAAMISSGAAWRPPSERRLQLDRLGEPLAALIRAAATARATDLQDHVVGYCRQHGDELTDCVIAALRTAGAATRTRADDAFRHLAADQVARLRARLARPARAGEDWSVELAGGCACDLCTTLRAFLADAARPTLEWPLAQKGRAHVHARIDQAELPVSHRTRRQGRPFTLVLAKTAQLFEREAQQRTRDRADLDRLLDQWSPLPEEASGR